MSCADAVLFRVGVRFRRRFWKKRLRFRVVFLRLRRRFREFQVDDLDLIAALLVEADGGAHQRADHFEVFLRACRVDDFALLVLGALGKHEQVQVHAREDGHDDGPSVGVSGPPSADPVVRKVVPRNP